MRDARVGDCTATPLSGNEFMNYFSELLSGTVRLLVGAQPRWMGCAPAFSQRIYFANHTSHLDALAIWAALPPDLRAQTRPVAAQDYWEKTALRRRVALQGFNAVFLDRTVSRKSGHPLQPLFDALESGASLIFFPEGTRHAQALPSEFKGGLYHLAERFPEVELVPVYLENLYRSMPKGTPWPLPLICTVRFGAALPRIADEHKAAFLARAREEVIKLA